VLTLGFGRRFATYKRATLLFNDLDWLREIVGDPDHPVLLVFAGKAHPADLPGQELIRTIHRLSNLPEFVGKILLVENYDISLARPLVAGVDVWLNNPVYPLEASGTSGMKAAINGTPNLSVLDGWWAEGYNGENGWGIKPSPHGDETRRDYEDARSLYETLQDHVVPLYYERGKHAAYSAGWVKRCKRAMASVIPRFNMERVLQDYAGGHYRPAARQGCQLAQQEYAAARELAAWKRRVLVAWPGVTLQRLNTPAARICYGAELTLEIAVQLNGLRPEDVTVELLVTRHGAMDKQFWAGGFTTLEATIEMLQDTTRAQITTQAFTPVGMLGENRECHFVLTFTPAWCGPLTYQIRAFPCHRLLTHPHEMGLMVWL
jgi:starch phosphorylase